MSFPILGTRGAVVSPHSLASQAGLDILRDGGNAIEATIAVAATLAVVYPHMTGIGGDGFWLLHAPGQPMRSIDACGAAGAAVTRDLYGSASSIPWRGPLAANTVAGTLSGWGAAYACSQREWGGRLPFARLLESAIHYAREGFPVTHSQEANTRAKLGELQGQPGPGVNIQAMVRDLREVSDLAVRAGAPTLILNAVTSLFEAGAHEFGGTSGIEQMYRLYESMSGMAFATGAPSPRT